VSRHRLQLAPAEEPEVAAAFADLRESLGVSLDFPPTVLEDAERAAKAPRLPHEDETDVPYVTIDPPPSLDLDQAMHLERTDGGYRVRYAIADVGAFVDPGAPMDDEAHARGETLYAPDADARLHPPRISEDAGSLLPGETRPALVWTMELDATGEGVDVGVRRALVRSRAKLDYAGVQRSLDDGTADEPLQLLREVGRQRQEREARLGGVQLTIPEQEVERGPDGYVLSFRAPLPVEGWNAQISLMTGMAAAELMLTAKVGILRTVPEADPKRLARLRRTATALDVPWPKDLDYASFVRGLDPNVPRQAAVLQQAAGVMRGSGYVAFAGRAPKDPVHAALASTYAHTTAPLRRLVDRYVGEICVAACAGAEVPDWVRAALPALPETMERSNRRAHQYEAGILSAVEAAVLEGHVGESFDAVVVELDEHDGGGVVQLLDPAVTARCVGELPLGERVRVRLTLADVAQRQVRFELA